MLLSRPILQRRRFQKAIPEFLELKAFSLNLMLTTKSASRSRTLLFPRLQPFHSHLYLPNRGLTIVKKLVVLSTTQIVEKLDEVKRFTSDFVGKTGEQLPDLSQRSVKFLNPDNALPFSQPIAKFYTDRANHAVRHRQKSPLG